MNASSEHDRADQRLEAGVADAPHEQGRHGHAQARRWHHPPHVVPPHVLVQRDDRTDVPGHQQRQHVAGRLARPEQQREYHDVKESDAGEAGLAETHAERGGCGKEPLEWREVGHAGGVGGCDTSIIMPWPIVVGTVRGPVSCRVDRTKRGTMRALTIATTLTLGITTTLAVAVPAQQHDHGAAPGRLGAVHFATSCAPAVQKDFDRGIALLHSFWFSAAIESFNSVLKTDPQCVMAQWGIAMSWWGNPFAGFRSPQAMKTALTALDAAKASGAGTDREKAYLAAVDLLFRDAATVDQRTHDPSRTKRRWRRWPAAMPTMSRRESSTRWPWLRPRCRRTRPMRTS